MNNRPTANKLLHGVAALSIGALLFGPAFVAPAQAAVSTKTTTTSTATTLPSLNGSVPTITGTPAVGSPLTANADWGTGVTYYYEWYRSAPTETEPWRTILIWGATGKTYTPTTDDMGSTIGVMVIGVKAGYETEVQASAMTATAVPAIPVIKSVQPTINGYARVGSTLTIDTGVWTPTPDYFTYQWKSGGKPIPGATGKTYVVTEAELNKTLTADVVGYKEGYPTVTRSSSASGTVWPTAPAPDPVYTGVYVSGTQVVGSTLTAVTTGWDATGMTYRWTRNNVTISGATSSTYKLTSNDKGKYVSVIVTGYVNGVKKDMSGGGIDPVKATGTITPAPAPTTVVAPAPAPATKPAPAPANGTVAISGSAVTGSSLSTVTAGWDKNKSLSYQWKRDGSSVRGASSAKYTISKSDLGKRLSVVVTGYVSGQKKSVTSASTTAVTEPAKTVATLTKPAVAPATKPTSDQVKTTTAKTLVAPAPSVKGTYKVNSTLRVTAGKWTSGTTLKYQWLRNGQAISGAVKTSYKLSSADRGKTITIKVTGSKSGYTTATVTSTSKTVVK